MRNAIRLYVHWVDTFNRWVGRFAMRLIFVMGAIMLYAICSRLFLGKPVNWVMEMSQFLLMGYFMLGGAYALQLGSAVRMDLLYTRWSDRTRAAVDVVTIFALIFYLGVLLWGGIESTQYALEYGERRRGLWRPYMAPIKIVMVIGIVLMILQCTAFLIRDIARLRGKDI